MFIILHSTFGALFQNNVHTLIRVNSTQITNVSYLRRSINISLQYIQSHSRVCGLTFTIVAD